MSSRTLAPLSAAAAARPLPDVAALAGFRPSATQRRFVQLAVAAQSAAAHRRALRTARHRPLHLLPLARPARLPRLDVAAVGLGPAWPTAGACSPSPAPAPKPTSAIGRRWWSSIFDPRGLGLLAAWQQRMTGIESEASASPVPLFTAQDSKEESEFEERLAALEEPAAAAPDEPPIAEPAASPEASTEIAPVAPAHPMESTTYASATQQNAAPPPASNPRQTEDPPSPCVPRIPPPWPSSGGRFQY